MPVLMGKERVIDYLIPRESEQDSKDVILNLGAEKRMTFAQLKDFFMDNIWTLDGIRFLEVEDCRPIWLHLYSDTLLEYYQHLCSFGSDVIILRGKVASPLPIPATSLKMRTETERDLSDEVSRSIDNTLLNDRYRPSEVPGRSRFHEGANIVLFPLEDSGIDNPSAILDALNYNDEQDQDKLIGLQRDQHTLWAGYRLELNIIKKAVLKIKIDRIGKEATLLMKEIQSKKHAKEKAIRNLKVNGYQIVPQEELEQERLAILGAYNASEALREEIMKNISSGGYRNLMGYRPLYQLGSSPDARKRPGEFGQKGKDGQSDYTPPDFDTAKEKQRRYANFMRGIGIDINLTGDPELDRAANTRAFRQFAKKYHPEAAGKGNIEIFKQGSNLYGDVDNPRQKQL